MRPSENEYAEYYAKYVELVKGENVLNVLENYKDTVTLLKSVPAKKENYFYAEGKWTVKQLAGHIIDTERIMAYRALRISRNDTQPLPGFDQDEYIKHGSAQRRGLADLAEEFEAVRVSNLLMFRSFNEVELKRKGTASGYGVTVLALLFIIAGHELHHIEILKERYL